MLIVSEIFKGIIMIIFHKNGILPVLGLELRYTGLIQVKEEGWTRAGRAAPKDFPRAKPERNPEEQLCQPEEKPVHPNSFTWIYIPFKIGHFGDICDFFQILMFEET